MTQLRSRIVPDADDKVADRPLRKNFNAVIFTLMSVMALVVLAGALFFHMRHSVPGPVTHPANTSAPQVNPSSSPQ